MITRLKRNLQRTLGVADIRRGRTVNFVRLPNLTGEEIRNSIIPARCLVSSTLTLNSERGSYSLTHQRITQYETYVSMQSNLELAEDFEEVKKRVSALIQNGNDSLVKSHATESHGYDLDYLIADFMVHCRLTPKYLGDLIDEYKSEFQVSNLLINYKDVPLYASRRLKLKNDASNRL
jgi:hypothetical protein